jgi:hypothetical protein
VPLSSWDGSENQAFLTLKPMGFSPHLAVLSVAVKSYFSGSMTMRSHWAHASGAEVLLICLFCLGTSSEHHGRK